MSEGWLYIVRLLAVAVAPLVAGHALARRWGDGAGARPWREAGLAAAGVGLWFAVSWLARRYAETDAGGWRMAEGWAHSGKWYAFGGAVLFFLGVGAAREPVPARRGRAARCTVGALLVVWSVAWKTMPIYVLIDRETKRAPAGHLRQSVEYTCGPVSLANLMELFHGYRGLSERDMARVAGTTSEGTTTGGLIRAARKKGLAVRECRVMHMDELAARGGPALVHISTLPHVRHGTLLLEFKGDEVRFVDPQYGYRAISRRRFSEIWYGKTLILDRVTPLVRE